MDKNAEAFQEIMEHVDLLVNEVKTEMRRLVQNKDILLQGGHSNIKDENLDQALERIKEIRVQFLEFWRYLDASGTEALRNEE